MLNKALGKHGEHGRLICQILSSPASTNGTKWLSKENFNFLWATETRPWISAGMTVPKTFVVKSNKGNTFPKGANKKSVQCRCKAEDRDSPRKCGWMFRKSRSEFLLPEDVNTITCERRPSKYGWSHSKTPVGGYFNPTSDALVRVVRIIPYESYQIQ